MNQVYRVHRTSLDLLSKTQNPLKTATWTDGKKKISVIQITWNRPQVHCWVIAAAAGSCYQGQRWSITVVKKAFRFLVSRGIYICMLWPLRVCDVALSQQFTTILIYNVTSSCCSVATFIFYIYDTDSKIWSVHFDTTAFKAAYVYSILHFSQSSYPIITGI